MQIWQKGKSIGRKLRCKSSGWFQVLIREALQGKFREYVQGAFLLILQNNVSRDDKEEVREDKKKNCAS